MLYVVVSTCFPTSREGKGSEIGVQSHFNLYSGLEASLCCVKPYLKNSREAPKPKGWNFKTRTWNAGKNFAVSACAVLDRGWVIHPRVQRMSTQRPVLEGAESQA